MLKRFKGPRPAIIICPELIFGLNSPSDVNVCYFGTYKTTNTLSSDKHYITEIHLRTINFRLLHFISLISSPLASLYFSLLLFLSKMDDFPKGIIMNKGLN